MGTVVVVRVGRVLVPRRVVSMVCASWDVHLIVQISLVVTMGVGVRVVLVPRERIVNLGFVE